MIYTEKKQYRDMGEFLFRKWMDGDIEPDDWHQSEYGGGFAQFGRRVIVDVEGLPVEYTRHETIEDACEEMDSLHTNRAPQEDDAIIQEHGSGYFAALSESLGHFNTLEGAEFALAKAMVDSGYFPDAFYINDRGNYHRIDDDIRAYHDEGGNKMKKKAS